MTERRIRMFGAPWCPEYKRVKQVVSAMGEGATAALMVREYMERQGEKASTPPQAPQN